MDIQINYSYFTSIFIAVIIIVIIVVIYYCYYYYHYYYYCYSRTFKLVKTDTNVSRNKPYYGEYYCKGGENLQISLVYE